MREMNQEIKKAITVSASIFIALVAYYGSWLPMQKSILFIDSMQKASNARTISDFEQTFSVPLDAQSPIGQEELVRSTANTIANSLKNVSDPRGVTELIKFAKSYYQPIIERGRGMSFGQDVYMLGAMNEFAYIKTGDKNYLLAAEGYFKRETELGPKRPQGLYGLLDVYRMEGRMDDFKRIADQVLQQWPADTRTKNIVDQVLKTAPQGAQK